ncbi:hypothetical protein HORIV_35540 [Vreelandella olivaria]|uniref:Uncharacterized protein n=1 Tax=Vreelandella olivaria TaxID=390919 RepID=A0ABM7GK75_9GAMM|nr:hypothetical protein HORIV_35540 [Halomonas olivaria]
MFTHITQEKVKSVWDQVVDEIKRNTKGNKTQQLSNNATVGEVMRCISARQMIFDAYHEQRGSVMAYAQEIARMGAQVQTTQSNNNDWRIVNGLEAGR